MEVITGMDGTPKLRLKVQGQDGVRFLLSCKALSSSTTCRFIPAHPQVGFELTTLRLTQPINWRRVQRFRLSVFRRGFVYAPQGCPARDQHCDVIRAFRGWTC